ERLGQQMHVPGEHYELDAVLFEPGRHDEVALFAALVAVEAERRRGDPGLTRADERIRVVAVRGDRGDGQPVVDQRLQVRPVTANQHPDHVTCPITISSWSASATIAHHPIPRLNTRRSSFSSTCRASQWNTCG